MKNIPLSYYSYGLNVLLITIFIFILVPEDVPPVVAKIYTEQDLSKSIDISPKMTMKEVTSVMGKPAIKEISGTSEEWHYCKTGDQVDEYVVISFTDNVVLKLSNYTVSWFDIIFKHTQTPSEELIKMSPVGDCKLTTRWGTYGVNQPNKKINKDT